MTATVSQQKSKPKSPPPSPPSCCNASICRLALARVLLWALHSGRLLSLVVAITGIAVKREVMTGGQSTSMAGAGIATIILYPALVAVMNDRF
jgi:hypothetical protein